MTIRKEKREETNAGAQWETYRTTASHLPSWRTVIGRVKENFYTSPISRDASGLVTAGGSGYGGDKRGDIGRPPEIHEIKDKNDMMGKWVEITFDCLPLRSVTRLDVPVDASPVYEQFVLRVKEALGRHGTHNTYYLHHGACTFHLTNDPQRGAIAFAFEGTVMTDPEDLHTKAIDITVKLKGETCGWLSEPIVGFLSESVQHAVLVEFGRYIEAGDLKKTEERIKSLQEDIDASDGFVGMYL